MKNIVFVKNLPEKPTRLRFMYLPTTFELDVHGVDKMDEQGNNHPYIDIDIIDREEVIDRTEIRIHDSAKERFCQISDDVLTYVRWILTEYITSCLSDDRIFRNDGTVFYTTYIGLDDMNELLENYLYEDIPETFKRFLPSSAKSLKLSPSEKEKAE